MERKTNRYRLLLLTTFLLFCMLSGPTAASAPQSILQDVASPLTESNWNFADLPEGAIIENNLENFIDQLSDIRGDPDIGTHSNPATLRFLDGIYDTLTSDNMTIPEQPIYDPETDEFLYNQSAYESWRLDLEGAWTDVDFNEISAELCVYGGTQAEESLKVDIWSNDGWINVIPDVMPGWNNVSIAPSLVDETLEMRFTGSDTGNTSIQNSWDIDAVLLHTWTTVYGSEFTQNGIIQDLGNNLSRYIASVGETNTWNEVTETWHRYLYDPDAKTVKIGNLTITHLPGGTLSIDGGAGSRVGKLGWFIQAYYANQWNNITLDNYQFVGFTKTPNNVTAHQRFWGSQGEMNVYLTYSYFGGFKTRVDIRNDAAQAVPIRAIWAAREVSGIQDNYQLLRNENDIVYGIQIEDAVFSWNDVFASDNPLPTQTAIDKPNRRAAVIFGNQSTIIPSGYTATIDPDYSMTSDAYDNYWDFHEDPTDTDVDNADHNKIQLDASYGYASFFAVPVTIVPYSIVTAATLTVYVVSESGGDSVAITRVDSANMPAIDDNVNGNGGSPPTIDTSLVAYLAITGTSWKTSGDIGKLVQETINEGAWASGNRMGFRLMPVAACAHTIEDYQDATSNHAKVSITYVAPSGNWLAGYGYRQAHSVDGSTGAGTSYQIKIAVEYGSGTSASGTIYCNSHCQTDFDDIRFTDNDGETELDYWMEEKTDSDDATFWVEVTDDLGSDQVIYCYYNNSGVSTTSDGDTTFIAFDDFEDNNLDKWEGEGANVATQSDEAYAGTYAVYMNPGAATEGMRYNFTAQGGTIDYNVIMTYFIKTSTTAKVWYDRTHGSGQTGYDMVLGGVTGYVSYYDGVYKKYPNNVVFGTAWQEIRHAYYLSGSSTQQLWRAGTDCGSIDFGPTINNPNIEYTTYSTQKALDTWMDNFYVRKFLATEPAHYTWANEQSPWPTNDATPSCTNLDDTDNLYGRYKIYNFSVSTTHVSAATAINYVELSSMNGATPVWTVRYTESDNSFSEQAGATYIQLTGSVYTKSGTNLDIWFGIIIEWIHPDASDYDLKQYVIDDQSNPDTDTYSAIDYDYETRLDFAPDPVLSDGSGTVDRGNYNTIGGITASATVEYYQSASHCRPPTGEVDVWVTCPDTPDTDWEATNYEASGGTFSVAVDSDDAITASPNTYTFKVVTQGGGSGGTNLVIGTVTDTYKADRVLVYGYYYVTDTRASLNQDVNITVEIYYDYDNSYISDGTVTVNGVAATYWMSDLWNFTDAESSVIANTYDTVVCSGNTHGVTSVDQNSQSQQVIWDRIQVQSYSVSDARDNINDNVNINATLWYDYDNSLVEDGTVTINGYSADYQGSGVWNITRTSASVTSITYNTVACSGNTYGITAVDQNSQSQEVIWDQIVILTTTANDGRIDYGTSATIAVTAELAYDHHALGSGDTLYMNGTSMTWDTDHFYLAPSFSAVDIWNFYVNSTNANEATHGITVVKLDGNSANVIWDRIKILTTTTGDSRIDYGTSAIIAVTAELEYDSHVLGSGDTLYMNGTSMTWDTDHFYLAPSFSAVDIWNFYVNSTNANEATHGITVVNLDGNSASVIWDRILILTTAATDGRINYGTSTTVGVTTELEYDSHALTDGDTLYMNGTSMTFVGGSGGGGGGYDFSLTTGAYNIVDILNYFVNSTGANEITYGITVINLDGNDASVIWDRIKILTTTTDDSRVGYNTQATIVVTAELEYDSHALGSGDTLYMNGTSMSWNGSHFILNPQFAAVDLWTFFVNSTNANEATHTITVINLDGNSVNQIWDRIYAVSLSYGGDTRVDIGTSINFDYELHYDYDEVDVSDGTITINGYAFADQGSGIWRYTNNSGSVGDITFDSIVASGNTHGITVATTNGNDITLIWDRIQVQTTSATASYINIDTGTTTINVTVFLDFDNAVIGGSNGSVTLNDTAMVWNTDHWYLTIGPYTEFLELVFYVNSSTDTTYSITAFDVNGQSATVGTDRVIVVSHNADDPRVNVDDYVNIYYHLAYESNYTTYNPDGLTLVDGTYDDGTYGDLATVNGVGYDFSEATGSPAIDLQLNFSAGAFQGISLYIYATNAHGVHELHLQMWNYTSGAWDFIVAVPHAVGWHWVNVTVNSAYGYGSGGQAIARLYHADVGNPTFEFYLDYVALTNALSYMQSGTVTIEGYEATHLGDGVWNITVTHDAVAELCFDEVVVTGNNRAITSVYNITCQHVIWDSLTITISVDDNRIDTGVNITMTVTSVYDYDGFASNCTYVVNDTLEAKATVGRWNYTITSVSGDAFGITLIGTNDEDYAIWDRIKILTTTTDNSRIDYDTQATIAVTAELEYDSHALGSGDTLYMNGTSMSWNGSHFILNPQFAAVDLWTFFVNSTSANEATHTITVINLDGNSVNQIWDRIGVTAAVNMTWTVIGYYINVSYTGSYEYDSTSWSGYATIANTSLTTGGAVYYEELTFSTVINKTFYATAIEDAGGYGLTEFTTNTVWCVWDNVIAGGDVDTYWHKEVGYSRLVWGPVSTWKWDFNGTWIDNTFTLHAYSNGSTPEATGGIYGSGNFAGFVVGPYDTSWYHLNLTVNCEVTIEGVAYNWEIWDLLMDVDILHTIYVENFEIEPTDYYFWIAYQTNWNNATIMIWDALINAGTSCADTILNGTIQTEGMYHWTRSTIIGSHEVTILLNGSASALNEQNKDFSIDDSWWWYNFTYVVTVPDFDVDIEAWSAEDVVIEITGISNMDINWYIYNEGVYSEESGSETEDIGFTFDFAKSTAIGKHNFSIYFNDTIDGSQYRWFNRSYTISSTYATSNIYTYNQGGDYVDWEQFTFLINGTQIYGNEFYNRTDHVYLITIQDVFGSNLYSAVHSWGRTIKITLDVYTFIVANMLDDQFIYFNMTRTGGATWSKHIVPTSFIEFSLLYAATYSYTYSTIATDGTVRTATGTVTVEEDTAIIIFNFGLVKVLSEIRMIAPGGGVGKEYVEKQFATVNATLGAMWAVLWFVGGFLVLALWIVPFVGKRRRKGFYSQSSKPSSGPSKPNKGIGGFVLRSAEKDARKQQKKLGIRQKDEREFGPRQ